MIAAPIADHRWRQNRSLRSNPYRAGLQGEQLRQQILGTTAEITASRSFPWQQWQCDANCYYHAGPNTGRLFPIGIALDSNGLIYVANEN